MEKFSLKFSVEEVVLVTVVDGAHSYYISRTAGSRGNYFDTLVISGL
jgi:hypothetical protein